MGRQAWHLIKRKNFFYIQTFRKAGAFLLISLVLNAVFIVAIYFAFTHQPERDFYATSGVTDPVKLTPMSTPNYSSEALLPPDPVNDDDARKVIPQ